MSDNIVITVAGGCPKCGNPDIDVPNGYEADTVIVCKMCGHQNAHKDFFVSSDD